MDPDPGVTAEASYGSRSLGVHKVGEYGSRSMLSKQELKDTDHDSGCCTRSRIRIQIHAVKTGVKGYGSWFRLLYQESHTDPSPDSPKKQKKTLIWSFSGQNLDLSPQSTPLALDVILKNVWGLVPREGISKRPATDQRSDLITGKLTPGPGIGTHRP